MSAVFNINQSQAYERMEAHLLADRTKTFNKQLAAKIEAMLTDPDQIWMSFGPESTQALHPFLTTDIDGDFYDAALELRNELFKSLAYEAKQDISPLVPVTMEDVADALSMADADDE